MNDLFVNNLKLGQNLTVNKKLKANNVAANNVVAETVNTTTLNVNVDENTNLIGTFTPNFNNQTIISKTTGDWTADQDGPGTITCELDLGVSGVSEGYVETFMGLSGGNNRSIQSFIGYMNFDTSNSQTLSNIVYVTEDYLDARRLSAFISEKQPDTSVIGFDTLGKTYSDLGFVAGTYTSSASLTGSIFGMANSNTYVQSLYLDNTDVTTKLIAILVTATSGTVKPGTTNFYYVV